MSRRHALLLILIAVILTLCSIALSKRDSRDWRANRSRRLLPFPWQDTASVTIKKPDGETLRFDKSQGGEWRIRLPHDLSDILSHRVVDELSALATLTWREPLAEPRPIDPATAVTFTVVSTFGQKVEFAFGDVANNLRATIVDGDDSVIYGVNQDFLNFLEWPQWRFRNYYLATVGGGRRPTTIELMPAGGDPGLRIALEHTDAEWRQTEPVAWPVDESRLEMLLRWIERLRAESIEAEMSGDLEWFGFGPESAYVEAAYDVPGGGEVRRRVEFGKATDTGGVYARVVGRDPIFAIPGESLAEISLNVAADHRELWRNFYRQRNLNAIGDTLPSVIVVEKLLPSPVKLTMENIRDRDGTRWRGKLESEGRTREFIVDPPDASEPMRPLTALITGLSTLRVKVFLADTAPGVDTMKWTAYPGWRFMSRFPDGAWSPALTLYAAEPDGSLPFGGAYTEGSPGPQELTPKAGFSEKPGIAFSLAGTPAVMETFAELSYLLCLPPYRYQSRRLLDHDPQRWLRVEITRNGEKTTYVRREGEVNEQWWLDATPPEPLMDDNNRFVAMLSMLSQLRSEGFVEDTDGDVTKIGLDRPEITAIVYTSVNRAAPANRDGLLFKLDVGDTSPAGRYARLNDQGPVFLISERMAEGLGDIYR